MGRAPAKDLNAFKRSYAQRPCIKDAALAAGYALNTAKQGIAPLPKQLRSFVLSKQRKLEKLATLARSVDATQQEEIVRGGILSNIAQGKDLAVQSLKLGGQDKRVNMFASDQQLGVVIVNLPDALANNTTSAAVSTLCLDGDAQ